MDQGLIRTGYISSVDEENDTARVLFPDRDNLVSYDMPVVRPYCECGKILPEPGERVLCVMLPNDIKQGFILGKC